MSELGRMIAGPEPMVDETLDEWVKRGGLPTLENQLFSEERTPTGEYKYNFDKEHYRRFDTHKYNPTQENLQRLFDILKKGQPVDGIPVS